MNRIDLDMLCAIADVYMTRQEERLLQTTEPSAARALCERIAPEFLLLVRALFRIVPVYDELILVANRNNLASKKISAFLYPYFTKLRQSSIDKTSLLTTL